MLKKVLTEKYIVLVSEEESGTDYIEQLVGGLKDFTIFNRVKVNSADDKTTGDRISGLIPSIAGQLEISRLWDSHYRDISVLTKFIYVEGTSEEDLNQVREIIKNSGLEEMAESPEIKKFI